VKVGFRALWGLSQFRLESRGEVNGIVAFANGSNEGGSKSEPIKPQEQRALGWALPEGQAGHMKGLFEKFLCRKGLTWGCQSIAGLRRGGRDLSLLGSQRDNSRGQEDIRRGRVRRHSGDNKSCVGKLTAGWWLGFKEC
jgi:hypothetical protein